MKKVIEGKVYNTDTAIELASDHYWDGHNMERGGRNTYLYKTKKGNFFLYHTTRWQGEFNYIEPISKDYAKEMFESLQEQEVEWEEAFNEIPEEA